MGENSSKLLSIFGGVMMPLFSIPLQTIIQTIILALIGAATGYFTNFLLKKLMEGKRKRT